MTELMSVKDWIFPLGILAVSIAAVQLLRWTLESIGRRVALRPLVDLAPQLSKLLLLFGLRLFVEFSPIPAKASSWIQAAIYVLGVFLVLNLVRRGALLGLEWGYLRSANGSLTLREGFVPLIRNLITLFVVLTGFIMVLKYFGYDVMSLLAALGVGSLAVGLAAQPTLSNMISGFTLIIDRNLKPGDRISIAGSAGEVEEIGLRSTRIRTGNGKMLIVPNSELVNTRLLNLSQPSRSAAVSSSIRLSQDSPFEEFRSLCIEIVGELPRVLRDKPASVNLQSLSELGLATQITFWVDDQDQEAATLSAFHERLLQRMKGRSIRLASTPLVAPGP